MMTWPRGQDNGQTGNRHPVPAFGTGPAVGETAGWPAVTILRRPPVRQSTMVRRDARHTFDAFVATMGLGGRCSHSPRATTGCAMLLWSGATAGGSMKRGTTAPRWTGARLQLGSRPPAFF